MDRVAYLDELISRAKAGFELYKPMFEKLSDAYLLYLDENTQAKLYKRNKSALFIPKINAKAKRIMDAFSDTYFSNDTFAKLDSFVNTNSEILPKWQKAIDFYCDRLNLYHIFQPEFLKITFLGTSIAKVYWSGDKAKIEMLDIDKVFFDPDAKNKDDIRFIVNEITATKADILSLAKKGIYKTQATKEIDENYPFERLKLYDIYEKQGDEWYLSTTINSNILRNKIKLNDGCPIIIGYTLPQVKRIDDENFVGAYGDPPLASILPLQEETNRIRNGIIDGISQHLKPKLIINKNSLISVDDIETPGKPIYTSDPRAVQIMPQPNVGAAFSSVQMSDNEMSEATGISPQQNGASTPRQETATMAGIMANEGSVRLQGYIRTLNETFFEPIFERFAILVWKYGDAMFFAGINRKNPMSFKVNLNTGIGALNKEVQKNTLTQSGMLLEKHFGLKMSIGDTQGAQKIVLAHEQLISQILKLNGVKDFDKYLSIKEGDELIRNAIHDTNARLPLQEFANITPSAAGEFYPTMEQSPNGNITNPSNQ